MEIRIATTAEEKAAIYSLRYRCYVEEMGWSYVHADTERGHLQDPADDVATLYYATDGGEVIATCRLHFGEIMIDEQTRERFALSRFDSFSPHCFSFIFRLVVLPEYRGSTIMIRLLQRCYEDGWKHGIRFSFCWCRPRLVPVYERLGFLRYKDNINSSAQGYVVPMVMLNEDSVHFGVIRSPFLRICSAHLPSPETTEWFDSAFPESRKTISNPTAFCLPDSMEPSLRLAGAYLLNGLSPEQLQSLLAGGNVLWIKAGDLVIEEDEAGDEMFLVLEGELEIYCRSQPAEIDLTIGILRKGQVLGELALVSRTRRNASVRARTDGRLLVISREYFQRLIKTQSSAALPLLQNLCEVLAEKLRISTKRLISPFPETFPGEN